MKKCHCDLPTPTYCGDCNKVQFAFSRDEVEDILSALSFFRSDYPREGSVETREAMTKLDEKIWKMIREARGT